MHTEAERSGVVRELLTGRISASAYALYLRNLLPAYETLEAGLQQRGEEPALAPFAQPALYRALAIAKDLAAVEGADWQRRLSIVPAAESYAALIAEACREDTGAALLAHAYVRYFGDLSGGQILRRMLMKTLALPGEALSVYHFADIADLGVFKISLRDALDAVGSSYVEPGRVIEEALRAFRANIALSLEIAQAAAVPALD